jgi:hypothetical protein
MNRANSKVFVPAASSSWSIEDIRKLKGLAGQGVSAREISRALRRTESAVRNKAALHGIRLKAAPRTCAA